MTLLFGSTSLQKPMYMRVDRLRRPATVSTGCCASGGNWLRTEVDLGIDLGERPVGVVVQAQRRR